MTHSRAADLSRVVRDAVPGLLTISESAASNRRSPDGWSVEEILGHLIDSAANNHQRFIRAGFVGQLAFPEYEQEAWVRLQDYQGRPWTALIELWTQYNRHLSHLIERLREPMLEAPCRIGTNDTVSLDVLIDDYLVHLRHHLDQILAR